MIDDSRLKGLLAAVPDREMAPVFAGAVAAAGRYRVEPVFCVSCGRPMGVVGKGLPYFFVTCDLCGDSAGLQPHLIGPVDDRLRCEGCGEIYPGRAPDVAVSYACDACLSTGRASSAGRLVIPED